MSPTNTRDNLCGEGSRSKTSDAVGEDWKDLSVSSGDEAIGWLCAGDGRPEGSSNAGEDLEIALGVARAA